MVLTRARTARRRIGHPRQPTTSRTRRTPTRLRRPEPDLHVALVAPGLPARVREQLGRQAGRDRQVAGGSPVPRAAASPRGRDVKAQAATHARPAARRRRRDQHPDDRGRPVRQLHPGPGPRPAAVRARVPASSKATAPTPVPVPANALALDTAFLNDIAHNADPRPDTTRPGTPLKPDADRSARRRRLRRASRPATYDNELLDVHFICGDGRCNENIALTAVHQVFHSEHDRLVDDIKNTLANDTDRRSHRRLADWQTPLGRVPTAGTASGSSRPPASSPRWSTSTWCSRSSRARFSPRSTRSSRSRSPRPTSTRRSRAEFAHAVYRFGHSMLTETIPRTNADGSHNDISLLDGFLNPAAYYDGGTAGTLTAAAGRAAASSWACRTRPATSSTSSSPTRSATTCWACRSTCRPST